MYDRGRLFDKLGTGELDSRGIWLLLPGRLWDFQRAQTNAGWEILSNSSIQIDWRCDTMEKRRTSGRNNNWLPVTSRDKILRTSRESLVMVSLIAGDSNSSKSKAIFLSFVSRLHGPFGCSTWDTLANWALNATNCCAHCDASVDHIVLWCALCSTAENLRWIAMPTKRLRL